ncbi:hypothetical protein JHK82_024764 [Glycine max]|uniref:Uncharacterized protein n=2 Tax=Glycine subgen. Soja TaxID=1462606 RepID=K7LDA7_SOYBN|nr:hypothetical protein JHK87_024717 [Glycine soja]KAG5006832.1 hypothetical protein JHK85_025374 [Glycine max]KAG5012621.1 hypothetical protein JHK86_024882 [Glycine max]KAG5133576.1 hypothetical protein JHK82_024764 [Glycine max]KAH1042559.1 hypothetical protein GYH30_024730 [Glycine max]
MPHDQIQKLTIMNIPLKKNQIHLDLLAILICCLQNGWKLDTHQNLVNILQHMLQTKELEQRKAKISLINRR